MTFMMQTSRMANLRPILQTDAVKNAMPAFVAAYERMSQEDKRGMRLDEIMRGAPRKAVHVVPAKKTQLGIVLDDHVYRALRERLRFEGSAYKGDGSGRERSLRNTGVLARSAIPGAVVSVSGIDYKCRTRSQGDSNVIFRHPAFNGEEPGRIEQIFMHRRYTGVDMVEEVYLVLRKLTPLSAKDQSNDPYRAFKIGGALYYDEYDRTLFVARPEDLVCHFVKTYMKGASFTKRTLGADGRTAEEAVRFERPCAHVMQLSKVCALNCPCSTFALHRQFTYIAVTHHGINSTG